MSKANTYKLADYVISGGHEEANCISCAQEYIEAEPDLNKSQIRKFMEQHIFYAAYRALYGGLEANKKITEMMREL